MTKAVSTAAGSAAWFKEIGRGDLKLDMTAYLRRLGPLLSENKNRVGRENTPTQKITSNNERSPAESLSDYRLKMVDSS